MTLREILARLLTLRLAALVCGAIAICVIAGPYHTLEMPLLPRAGYWTIAILVATAMSMTTITYAFAGPLFPKVPPLVRGLFASVLFSLAYAGFLVLLGMTCRIGNHLLNLVVRQTARCFDDDVLTLACRLVLG